MSVKQFLIYDKNIICAINYFYSDVTLLRYVLVRYVMDDVRVTPGVVSKQVQ